jgi:hypothetical protein
MGGNFRMLVRNLCVDGTAHESVPVPLYVRYRINENHPDFIRSRRIFHQTVEARSSDQRA